MLARPGRRSTARYPVRTKRLIRRFTPLTSISSASASVRFRTQNRPRESTQRWRRIKTAHSASDRRGSFNGSIDIRTQFPGGDDLAARVPKPVDPFLPVAARVGQNQPGGDHPRRARFAVDSDAAAIRPNRATAVRMSRRPARRIPHRHRHGRAPTPPQKKTNSASIGNCPKMARGMMENPPTVRRWRCPDSPLFHGRRGISLEPRRRVSGSFRSRASKPFVILDTNLDVHPPVAPVFSSTHFRNLAK